MASSEMTIHVEPSDIMERVLDETTYKGITLRTWADFLSSEPMDGLYLCDPQKATKCPKTNCYLNGGECHRTTQKSQAASEGE